MYIDSHAHILNEFYDNKDEILKNSISKGVKKIINCADTLETSKEVINLSRKYKNVIYPAIGIHPENIVNVTDNDIKDLENLIDEKVVAIGEIGLDYYYGKDTKDKQIEFFEKQLALAEKYNIPVIIHSREATLDTLNSLKKYNLKGVIHCFSGSVETAREYIKMGFLLGINGIVTFKNSKNIKNVVKELGIDNFILETDCPFLTPEPYRKYKNDSSYIPIISAYLSELLGIEEEKVMKITTGNVYRIFDMK